MYHPKLDALLPDDCPKIGSSYELLASKLAVIQQRTQAKDYLEIHALLKSGLSLAAGLSHLDALHLPATNWIITLKTLVYFKGGDLESLPSEVIRDLEEAVRSVGEVPKFEGVKMPLGSS